LTRHKTRSLNLSNAERVAYELTLPAQNGTLPRTWPVHIL
jgi:hypothetical protein